MCGTWGDCGHGRRHAAVCAGAGHRRAGQGTAARDRRAHRRAGHHKARRRTQSAGLGRGDLRADGGCARSLCARLPGAGGTPLRRRLAREPVCAVNAAIPPSVNISLQYLYPLKSKTSKNKLQLLFFHGGNKMYSVTQRISKIKQPRGGYIKRKDFTCITLEDGIELNSQENIHPSLIGLVIDYMTRFCMGTPKETAFHISILGAKIAKNEFVAYKLLSKINGLDTESIISASKLVGYDVCYRAGMAYFKPVSEITPDTNTITNIITMIKRTLSFWEQYGPIIKDGFTFEGGYTSIISAGDGDYLTKDTLWDLKVLKEEIKPKYTLQLLVYLIMGQHSVHKEFKNITQLGIYNPRLNKVYIIKLDAISQSIIDTVSRDVIGYGISSEELKELHTAQLDELKKNFFKTPIQKSSPNANDSDDYLDKKIYGYSSKKNICP